MKTFKIEIGNEVHEILAQEDGGKWWVAAKPLCEILGIAWQRQHAKITTSERIRYHHMVTPSVGGDQEMLCIELEHVAAWLFGINPNKVKEEIRQQLILFQDKLQLVLYTAVFGNPATAALQKEVVELRKIVGTLSDTVMTQHSTIQILTDQVQTLERNSGIFGRFVKNEAKNAGSRLAHQRWAKKGLN